MRIFGRLVCFSLPLALSVAALAQSQFGGKWQTKIAPVTGKPPITIYIVEIGNKLSGHIIFVKPNGTQYELPIVDPQVNGSVLKFHTEVPNSFDWRMTLGKNTRTAHLHGNDRPGEGGEMVIEYRLWKKGQ